MSNCIYCGSPEHSSAVCQDPIKASTMTSLYGGSTKPCGAHQGQLIINAYTFHDPLMIDMSCAKRAYRRSTSLHNIVVDGWAMGFDPAQTAMEAMHMGYSLCVVLPYINSTWARLDVGYAAYCEEHGVCDSRSFAETKHADQYALWDADPNCVHDEVPQSGGGVKCSKCGGWFCF